MHPDERLFQVTFTATITVAVEAESAEDARDYAESDIIAPLCNGSLIGREMYMHDDGVKRATVAVDDIVHVIQADE